MNRIFRLVWNAKLRAFVVASEHTSRQGKGGRRGVSVAASGLLVAMGLIVGSSAYAQDNRVVAGVDTSAQCDVVASDGSAATAVELRACEAAADVKVASGLASGAEKLEAQNDVHPFIGIGESDADEAQATGYNAIALGAGTEASEEGAMAIGANALSNGWNSMALGQASTATANGAVAIGDGAQVLRKENGAALSGGVDGIAIGTKAFVGVDPNGTEVPGSMPGKAGVAIGASARTYGRESVALGANSVADEDFVVSVGDARQGMTRRIVNLAAGTDDNDATTLGQLRSAVHALGGGADVDADGALVAPTYTIQDADFNNVGDALGALDQGLNTLRDGILVEQPAADGAITVGAGVGGVEVDFANKEGGARVLKGIANGEISETSAEAVNGSQLQATNTLVDEQGRAISAHNQSIGDLQGELGNLTTKVGENYDDLKSRIDDLDPGVPGLVEQPDADGAIKVGQNVNGGEVDFTNAGGGARILMGVADGEVSATSTQAVNGSQLNATNTLVNEQGNTIAAHERTIGGLQFDVSQLDTNVGRLGTTVLAHDQTIGDLQSELGTLDGTVGTLSQRVTDNYDDLKGRIDDLEPGTPGLVEQPATDGVITVGSGVGGTEVDFTNSTGEDRVLKGVASGELSATSKEAVNGSQLNATNALVSDQGTTITAHGQTIGELQTGLTTLDGTVGSLSQTVTENYDDLKGRIDDLDPAVPGLVEQPDADGAIKVGQNVNGGEVDFTNVGGDARVLKGVADGEVSATSTQAVNGRQLDATNQNVAALDQRVDALETGGGGPGEPLIEQDVATGDISIGGNEAGGLLNIAGVAGERVLTGVAAGQVGAGSRDAVNGEQLAQIRDELSNEIGDLGDRVSDIERGGGTPDPKPDPDPDPTPEPENDHVERAELERQIQQAKDYSDSHYESLKGSVDSLRQDMDDRFEMTDRRIDRIGAMGTAMSMMSSSMSAVRGQNRIAAGLGGQGSEQALAVGYQHIVEDTNAAITVGGSFSGGESQIGVGFGFGF